MPQEASVLSRGMYFFSHCLPAVKIANALLKVTGLVFPYHSSIPMSILHIRSGREVSESVPTVLDNPITGRPIPGTLLQYICCPIRRWCPPIYQQARYTSLQACRQTRKTELWNLRRSSNRSSPGLRTRPMAADFKAEARARPRASSEAV